MNGATSTREKMTCTEKWAMVNKTIFNERIAILALQETHLDDSILEQIQTCFGRNLEIINSPLSENPCASAGVAFVINKALIKPKEYEVKELVPGRAISLRVKWLEKYTTTITNIYVPYNRGDQPEFWAMAKTCHHTLRLPLLDIVLGDFNVTEDAIDRAPAHIDDLAAIEALREVRCEWNIQDTWRHANPSARQFTYHANVNGTFIHSRLDRIYTSEEMSQHVFDWQMKLSAVPTDHWLVKVKYSPCDTPQIRSGRWSWPLYLLENKSVMVNVEKRGNKLLSDLEKLRASNTSREINSPQTLWNEFKKDISMLAKNATKSSFHKLNSRIKAIEKDLQTLTDSPDLDTNEETRTNAAFLMNELEHLEKVKAKSQRDKMKADLANRGECLGGSWSAISNEKKPQNLIMRLKIPNSNPTQYECYTKNMVEIARRYHESVQIDETPRSLEERKREIQDILQEVPESQRLPVQSTTAQRWKMEENHISQAIDLSKEGMAAGLDGCLNELWRMLRKRYESALRANKRGFNVVKVLTQIF